MALDLANPASGGGLSGPMAASSGHDNELGFVGGTGLPSSTVADSATATTGSASAQLPGPATKAGKGRAKRSKPGSPSHQPLAAAGPSTSPTPQPAPSAQSYNANSNLNTCEQCGLEFYVIPPFQPSSWLRIVYEALKKLHEEGSPHRKYFHYKHDICGYIDKHWSEICPEKKRTLTWNNTVSAVITTHRKLFKSNRKQSGYWTLRSQSGAKGSGSSDEDEAEDEDTLDANQTEGRRKPKKAATAPSIAEKPKNKPTKKRSINEITPGPLINDDIIDAPSSVSSSTTSASADSPTLTSPGPTSDDEAANWPNYTTQTPAPAVSTTMTVPAARRRKTSETSAQVVNSRGEPIVSSLPLQQPPPPNAATNRRPPTQPRNTSTAAEADAMAMLNHNALAIDTTPAGVRPPTTPSTTNPALLMTTPPTSTVGSLAPPPQYSTPFSAVHETSQPANDWPVWEPETDWNTHSTWDASLIE